MSPMRTFDGSDVDYGAVMNIHNTLFPEWFDTVESMKASDASRDPKRMLERVLWEEDEKPVAYATFGESTWSYRPGKYFISIRVLPDWQRRGIGTALYDHVVDVLSKRDPEPAILTSDAREDMEHCVRFLTSRGYERVQRQEVSMLDVGKFDFDAFASRRGAVERAGLEVVTGVELAERYEDWRRKLYDLDWEILQDVPVPDRLTRQPLERWVKEELEHPAFLPEGWFLAMDGDEPASLSSVWTALGDPKRLYQGLTGTRRPYRRKGLATDLKIRVIEFARDRGVDSILTDNEENNPMYGINVALGYRKMPAWLSMRKKLKELPPDDETEPAV